MTEAEDTVQRLKEVRHRIKRAASKAGREVDDIKLLAAAKKQAAVKVAAVADKNVIIGENRLKELKQHQQKLNNVLGRETTNEWHFIGHLQRNKVHKVLPRVDLVHSLDSRRLAKRIERIATREQLQAKCLVQVNIGREDSKYGLLPENLFEFMQFLTGLTRVQIRGLMCLPPYFPDHPEKTRPYFSQLRKLSREIASRYQQTEQITMDYLSMGMSNDFEHAIACGANLIRLGRAIFGRRD